MAWERGPCLGGWSLRPGTGGVRLKAMSGLPELPQHDGAIFWRLNQRERKIQTYQCKAQLR